MLRCLYVLFFLISILTGCVAPGSARGHVFLRGSLELDDGQPLPDRQVNIMVPAEYGLGGFDLRFGGKPEDFGRQDEKFSVVTDESGKFALDLGDRHYHVSVWFLPPLGAFPRNPPRPFLLLRIPSFPGERYAVLTGNGQFKIFGKGEEEIPLSQAHLSALSARSESGKTDGKRGTVGIVNLRFRLP